MDTVPLFLGVDIGSTTVKTIVLDQSGGIIFARYARHYSDVHGTTAFMLREVESYYPGRLWEIALTGSGAMALAQCLGLTFVQEVIASTISIQELLPKVDVAIELGGEDAKLTFFQGGADQRMNETCAGGTGAFIDQMAAFIQTDAAGLDELALRHSTIYPIASRCGVFAKTDILPLLNQGSSPEDIAASIMQAVVHQTISGLARGRSIEGTVVFLGGPLTFLRSLRERFVETLKLSPEQAVFPDHAEFFVAIGAALHMRRIQEEPRKILDILPQLEKVSDATVNSHLPPLFATQDERTSFVKRHTPAQSIHYPLERSTGSAWLGFDSGSTTMKAVLIDAQGRILYSFYGANQGNPLEVAVSILKDIHEKKPVDLTIQGATATGYGSALLCAGLGIGVDEVETVAHLEAARFFNPKVSFILDIGGQDIKCLHISDGVIDHIQLNEACSAGCGSFIENFANSLNLEISRFVDLAIEAKNPVDLGTRCTVFMNSKVKQVQKEGASIGDIAAGLCYAVIRNACYKVMKINNPGELGDEVVVQGGAFLNDGLLRALELEIGRNVTRPPISGLMGAFGAALIARKNGIDISTHLPTQQDLANFSSKMTTTRCKHCSNQCLLTVTRFPGKRHFISGNRCERGAEIAPKDVPNLYAYKYQRVFDYYVPLEKSKARRGVLGIPRTLNMYDNYPLWFTLFTHLGFRVELSTHSSKELFFSGYETIPSQTVCYPAKLAHGHIIDLAERELDAVFFPCIPFEQKDFASQDNCFNCPVVIGYPELLDKNISLLREKKIPFIHDFLPLSQDVLAQRLLAIPFFASIAYDDMEEAVRAGFAEWERCKNDIRKAGEEAIQILCEKNLFGIVLSGHPYHVDPAIHHGLPDLIASYGLGVLTEDSVAHLMPDVGKLRVVDQWTYHARLYRAGAFVGTTDNLAILQLVSFGCGLDAITGDQLKEIVTGKGRLYAQIKIDEGANLGPARIRIRSLLAALQERKKQDISGPVASGFKGSAMFTKAMRATHTILIPQMSPMHFQFLETVLASEGYKAKQLPRVDRQAIDLGLRYVNNDACFPAIITIGQLLQAVQSGEYDTDNVALLISETGGGCRATNYIAFLRKALVDCGLEHIPILSFVVDANQKDVGFSMSGKMLRRAIMAGVYGDALMRVLYRVRPYELEPGSALRLADLWTEKGKECIASGNILRFEWTLQRMIRAFDKLPLRNEKRRPRVGLVGEILLKYHPDANNDAVQVIEQEGGEAVVPDLMDFILYCLHDNIFEYKHLSGSWKKYISSLVSIKSLDFCRWTMRQGFRFSKRFAVPPRFKDLQAKAAGVISLGHQTGEGWLLTAEMVKLLESGVSNILCMQPFGCLPNHITGKGVLKELKIRFPSANIMAVDYDPGASEVNQINRIKLMMSVAR